MSAQKGKDLLKLDDGSGNFVTVAGLRTRQLALNADTVDVTNGESAGRWRELLAGAGITRASVAGTVVFKDETSDALMRSVFFDALIRTWQIIIPANCIDLIGIYADMQRSCSVKPVAAERPHPSARGDLRHAGTDARRRPTSS
jgi:TP901-1 family phage major tail protein